MLGDSYTFTLSTDGHSQAELLTQGAFSEPRIINAFELDQSPGLPLSTNNPTHFEFDSQDDMEISLWDPSLSIKADLSPSSAIPPLPNLAIGADDDPLLELPDLFQYGLGKASVSVENDLPVQNIGRQMTTFAFDVPVPAMSVSTRRGPERYRLGLGSRIDLHHEPTTVVRSANEILHSPPSYEHFQLTKVPQKSAKGMKEVQIVASCVSPWTYVSPKLSEQMNSRAKTEEKGSLRVRWGMSQMQIEETICTFSS
jgi:hypothetical protein